jgi:hypothetical protein
VFAPKTRVTVDFGDVVSEDVRGADVLGLLAGVRFGAGKSLLPTELSFNLRTSFAISASLPSRQGEPNETS